MGNDLFSQLLNSYQTEFEEEIKFKDLFKKLIEHPRAFHRNHLPGHITGSAWVLNENHSKVLMVHHARLNRWLQPGGHADRDEDVLSVALRELKEETGIRNVIQLGSGIFDLDVHPIPARIDFPQHDHYDVRFAFQANESEPLIVSDESNDVKWISFEELHTYADNNSILRMAGKSLRLG